ncbi:MAG: hypothetical protein UY99_C0014G0019 [Parcubacteria group bacterium GW2011_GWA1_59_11]|nr:MAG: hypothetical protein UY99_C0014G0019 [Parcubacteria group bacterium GW2011_GWA1_59_11]
MPFVSVMLGHFPEMPPLPPLTAPPAPDPEPPKEEPPEPLKTAPRCDQEWLMFP